MTPSGPLAGIRIVEFDAIGPVPLASMLLADLGAEIVRLARAPNSGQAWDDTGGAILHRNRKHVHVDLKSPADRDQALALIGKADAVLAASIFHFGEYSILQTKRMMAENGIPVRL